MRARSKSEPKNSTATFGFEIAAARSRYGNRWRTAGPVEAGNDKVNSATLQPKQGITTPQVLSKAKRNTLAFPGHRFSSTQIPVCLWFLGKNKAADAKRVNRAMIDADLEKFTSTHHAWRGTVGVPPSGGTSSKDRLKAGLQPYADLPGFCQSTTLAALRDMLLPKLLSGELSGRELNASAP